MSLTETTLIHRLDHCLPVAHEVKLGQVLEDLITQQNALLAALEAAALAGLNLSAVAPAKLLGARQ